MNSEKRVEFTSEELEELKRHKIVIFADRVIFNAQPPMTQSEMRAISEQCLSEIPDALKDLWSFTAGGNLDYELICTMEGYEEGIGFTELFFNGSNSYRDLQGWIDYEKEMLYEDEYGEDSELKFEDLKLDLLPIGGYDYSNRIYVDLRPGEKYGRIGAMKLGYPGCSDLMAEDGSCFFGKNLYEAFGQLHLRDDPFDPVEEFSAGHDFFACVDAKIEEGLTKELADKIKLFYAKAKPDWKSALEDRTIAANAFLARLATLYAIVREDSDLLIQLRKAGVTFDKPIWSKRMPVEVALASQKPASVKTLLENGATFSDRDFRSYSCPISPSLMKLIIEKGANLSVNTILSFAESADYENARLAASKDLVRVFQDKKDQRLKVLKEDLEEMRTSQSYSAEFLEESSRRIDNLVKFELY